MPKRTQWLGQEGAVQSFASNAWLERDGQGVDLRALLPWSPAADTSCDGCAGMPVHGVRAPVNYAWGIERCDECAVFASDLEAASALAEYLGPEFTVWFWQQ